VDLGITGKRAVIIGGSSGLGAACSEALAAEGANIVIFARRRDALERIQDELIARYGVTVDVVTGDLTERADVARLAASLAQGAGADILVLNTPRPPSPMREFLEEVDDDRWSDAYRNQLHGALNVLREITPLLLNRGWGRIIGITSASVKQPMPRHAISSIFRAGVQAALKHLVAEVGPHGVTVNAVAPATIVTPTFAQFHNLEERVLALPLKRAGTAQELGATVAFLASIHAGFITGQLIQVDGGMTASLV
jgi:3-oxoacyl-[acyl-carrier protein] reductase